jgi:hypothetical protein
MLDRKHCAGCHNDDYNDKHADRGGCWHRAEAKVRTRYWIDHVTGPLEPGAFTEVSREARRRQ